MHGNDFKHHFQKLYIIFDHINHRKSYLNHFKIDFFCKENKYQNNSVFNFFEAKSIQAFSIMK